MVTSEERIIYLSHLPLSISHDPYGFDEERIMIASRLLFSVAFPLVTLASIASPAQAQPVPSGPVKIITQQGAGGGTDAAMRLVIDHLSKLWGQQAVLVSQPGAGGALAARVVAEALPDGHTLFMALASAFVVLPELQPNLPFKVNDFAPVAFVGEVPMAIAVAPTLQVQSLPELIAQSKRLLGGLNAAVAFRGGVPHLTTELFRTSSGANLTTVHYPSSAQSMNDVISGRVPVIVEGLGGPVGAGQVKVLAIASSARLASRPEIPTVSETVPGFVASGWYVLVAPRGTPASIVEKLNHDLRTVLAYPDVKQRFNELTTSTRSLSPEQVGDFIRGEQQLWKPVVKRLGLPPQ
jgi:tripartite-type tricarboxylate transporter receptor subunit TctC